MDTVRGVLEDFRAAVEGGKRMRAEFVRSLLSRKKRTRNARAGAFHGRPEGVPAARARPAGEPRDRPRAVCAGTARRGRAGVRGEPGGGFEPSASGAARR